MLGVSRCKMRHLQTILAGSTVCFGHNHRQPRTEIFNSRRRSNEGIKRGAIWDFMTGKSPWGNPQIPILLLNGQGEKTPFVESLPPCFSTEPDYPPGTGVHVVCILPRIERIGRTHVLSRSKNRSKSLLLSLGLRPLQPDAYAHPCKRASLSDPPHPSGLPTGRQESIKTK